MQYIVSPFELQRPFHQNCMELVMLIGAKLIPGILSLSFVTVCLSLNMNKMIIFQISLSLSLEL